jgi:8-oxo-dGTP diphosphatase
VTSLHVTPEPPIVGAGVVLIEAGKVLLVRRANPPRAGEWSLPGGKQIAGERIEATALRELREETGLEAELIGLVDVVDAIFKNEAGLLTRHYLLVDFAARPAGGHLAAGSDALDAAWHPFPELARLGLWSETLRIIEEARKMFP